MITKLLGGNNPDYNQPQTANKKYNFASSLQVSKKCGPKNAQQQNSRNRGSSCCNAQVGQRTFHEVVIG